MRPGDAQTPATWGLYLWFEEHGVELIHADDRALARSLLVGNRVFRVIAASDEFLRLRWGEHELRVRPALFKAIDVAPREVGSEVTLLDGRVGRVVDVRWHFNRAAPMYFLTIHGKRQRRQYWDADFAAPRS